MWTAVGAPWPKSFRRHRICSLRPKWKLIIVEGTFLRFVLCFQTGGVQRRGRRKEGTLKEAQSAASDSDIASRSLHPAPPCRERLEEKGDFLGGFFLLFFLAKHDLSREFRFRGQRLHKRPEVCGGFAASAFWGLVGTSADLAAERENWRWCCEISIRRPQKSTSVAKC